MPLLGKKSYSFASPPDEIQQNDEVFVIKQTNEVFKSYEEYVDKILLYSSQIWSCQYTGKSMLSFEDALESEENALKSVDKFPKCFKKAVLNTAHHWTSGLEALVDKCHKDIHSNFNEKDAVNVNTGSKVHSGHVVNVHTDEEDLPPSPLSDKENLDDQDGKPSSKKFYDVLCKDSGECLKNVKAANISHSEKCPSKNLISLFIRANLAHPVGMGGQTTAFVLKKDVLEKYSIPHKLKEFSVSKKNANSEPLATIQHVNNSKPKKSTEKPKKCSPEKPLSDSKPKGKKLDPLQRSLDFFRVKQPGNEPLKSQKKIEENDNVKSPKKTGKIEDVPVTPTKGAKEALVILDKCPKISPVKVKCKGDRIMIESLSSSTESDENENCFEIKSKKFRCTPNLKEKANAFALLKSPQAGMENSAKKKTSVKQKKEKNGKNEKEKEKKKEKKEDGKIDTPAKNESKNFNKMEVKLIRIDASPSKSSIKTPEKKNEKKSEKKEQKENSNKKSVEKETRKSSNTAKSKVKSKDSGSKKTSKKSLGSVVANKAVKRLVTNEETKFKKSDTSLVVIVEDCQDMPNKDTATNLEPKIMETDSKVLQKKTENSKKKQKTLSEMFNAALQRDKPSSLTRVINKAIEENISSPSVLDLTTPAREKVQHKWEQMREKHKWKFMSAEEKQKIKDERLQKRREKLARQRREKRRLQREEMLKRLEETKKIEDTELELKPLPEGKPIDVPQELTIECFADVIMIVEFILCYKDLLVPEEKFNLTAESLMNALAAEEKGSSILSSVLVIFLQILLQDLQGEKKSRYCGSKLSDMPLTQHSAPELARLYLKRMLSSSSKGNQLERKENSQELLDIIKSMEENEFFTLLPQDKLKLLVSLCHAVISSDAIDNYIEAKKETDMEIKRQKKAEEKEIRDKMKEEKERNEQLKKKELEEQKNSTAENNQDSSNTTEEKSAEGKSVGKTSIITALTAENKKPSEKKDEKETSPEKEKKDSTSCGIAQTIRNRRLQLELNKQETEKKKAEELERRLKEEEERRKEQVEQERQANVAKLKQALRITPIGYDRYHRRYWLFTGMSGLYVEDGWMSKYITHVTPETNDECVIDGDRSVTNEESITSNVKTSNDASVTKSDGDDKTNENGSTNAGSVERAGSPDAESKEADVAVVSVETKQRDKTSAENDQKSSIDKSMRDVPYSWTYYDDPDEINALLGGLASRGIRESALHQVLTNETNIAKNIKKRATAEDKPAQDEGENKMLDYFKQDLLDTADRVTRGNLGEIDKMERYQKSLEKATNLGPLLIKLQESIFPRFLKGSFTEESVINEWRQSALKASTLSLLHLLLEILDSAIVWDKSAENAKCKVCRQKGSDDDLLLLCDECNRGYHLHCLRPAINKIPRGEWKCPSCQPVSSARSQRDRKEMYKDETIEDDSDDSSESEEDADNEIQNEDYCNICQEGGNELVCCDTCPLVFHKDCHDPPLRNIPRGTWSCMECKRPKPRKTRKQQRSKQVAKGSKKKQSKNAPNTRKRKLSSDESSNESFDGRTNRRTMRKRRLDPEDDSDEECQKKRRVTRSKKVVIEESEEEEEEESEEEVESDEECQKKRRVTRSKKVVIEESEEEEEEESEEEEEEEEEDSSEEEKEEGSGSEDEEESENEEEEEEEEEFVVKPQRNKRASNRAEPKPQPKAASRRDKRKAPSKAVKNVANTGSSKRRRTNPELETCEIILIEILRSEDSWPFLVPVNVKEVPDYFDFVSEPMDFQTIKDKLETLQYSDGKSFVHDVQLVFENCEKYNHILSETGQAGERLSNDFKRLLRENLPQYVGNPKRTSRKR